MAGQEREARLARSRSCPGNLRLWSIWKEGRGCPRQSAGVTTPLRLQLAIDPLRRLVRLDPGKLRQLMPEPSELPLGIMTGVGTSDLGGLLQRELADKMPDQRRHAMR